MFTQKRPWLFIVFIALVRVSPQLFGRIIQLRFYNIVVLPPQPAGCAPCIGAAFASLKKYAPHFFKEAKEAPYAGADKEVSERFHITLTKFNDH
jgi:hypothetical protein